MLLLLLLLVVSCLAVVGLPLGLLECPSLEVCLQGLATVRDTEGLVRVQRVLLAGQPTIVQYAHVSMAML